METSSLSNGQFVCVCQRVVCECVRLCIRAEVDVNGLL